MTDVIDTQSSGTEQAWAALGGDPALLDRIDGGGPAGLLPARLPVMELARSTVAVCALAAAELAARRAGSAAGPVERVRVDDGAVATAFLSERHLRVDGRAPTNFAPLSRFWRTADGWVRTHANYPHHRARLLASLDLPADTGVDVVARCSPSGGRWRSRRRCTPRAVWPSHCVLPRSGRRTSRALRSPHARC